jgi:type IV pilus assembly protein PilY1
MLVRIAVLAILPLLVEPGGRAAAQTPFTEDFTKGTTNNNWYFLRGACLTAGTSSSATSPGVVPSCASIASSYYATAWVGYRTLDPYLTPEVLVGGQNGVAGISATLPDPVGQGALRFTNGYPYGIGESGAIVSASTFSASSGVDITFSTVAYRGDSGGPGASGADGISFYLLDGSISPSSSIWHPVGSVGGALSYACGNATTGNSTYYGVVGGYLGIGIDEYGNFSDGNTLSPGTPATVTLPSGVIYNSVDWYGAYFPNGNTAAAGYGYHPNRIMLRGAGSVAWSYLNYAYPAYYPSTMLSSAAAQSAAVANTCTVGSVLNYSASAYSSCPIGSTSATSSQCPPVVTNSTLASAGLPTFYDYAPIPGAFVDMPNSANVINESAMSRPAATPLRYHLMISKAGLLSFSYSINGGTFQQVITNQSITASNGPLPSTLRFGFAASAGGNTNIHEMLCFQAGPPPTAQSSAASNQKQSAPVVQGTQVYFSYYDPSTWAGSVTAQSLLVDANNNVYFESLANWDASCVLSGVLSGSTCTKTGVAGPTTAQPISASASGGRTMLTWSGSAGIAFEWASLTSAEQAALDTGDGSSTAYRLNYLRGDRTNEQTSAGTGALTATGYRDRVSVLGDIVDSGPTWVGPPALGYPTAWVDDYDGGTMPENSGQSYAAFKTQAATRMNVVYAGANDGFLHGFRSGYFNASGTFVGTGSGASFTGTDNDGQEVLAYMPAYVLGHIQSTTAANDYSSPQYAHQFDVDATPGTGDVFYGGAWHTLLVGGLGPGGSAIYALDVTNPGNMTSTAPTFSESNAASLVIGEWSTSTTTSGTTTTTTSNFSCTGSTNSSTNTPSCGLNLGNTYGTPQIRRFHNGLWGAVFGNGFGSSTGDAGIYVMVLNASTGAPTFYYLSTGTSGTGNGIAYVSPVDLDGDHVTDYVYAGDLSGNVWRFDLTNTNPRKWTVTMNGSNPQALFTTPTGQPITSKLLVTSIVSSPQRRILVEFGTGRQVPQTTTSAALYSTSQQALYGIWDWNLSTWNANSTVQYAALSPTVAVNGTLAPSSISTSNLQLQTFASVSSGGVDYRTVSNTPICWAGTLATGSCTTSAQYGWYLQLGSGYANAADVNLPTASAAAGVPLVYEQAIYNPTLVGNAFIVNTTIPPASALLSCFSTVAGGFTMAVNPATGGATTQSVFSHNGQFTNLSGGIVGGLGQSGTGSVLIVTSGTGAALRNYLATQTVSGTPVAEQVNLPNSLSSIRLTWVERR